MEPRSGASGGLMSRVVVVGAGLGGLASALFLARRGHDVALRVQVEVAAAGGGVLLHVGEGPVAGRRGGAGAHEAGAVGVVRRQAEVALAQVEGQ